MHSHLYIMLVRKSKNLHFLIDSQLGGVHKDNSVGQYTKGGQDGSSHSHGFLHDTEIW